MIKENYEQYITENIKEKGFECIKDVNCSIFVNNEFVAKINKIVKDYLLSFDNSNFQDEAARKDFLTKKLAVYVEIVKEKKKQYATGEKPNYTANENPFQEEIVEEKPKHKKHGKSETVEDFPERVLVSNRERYNLKTTKSALVFGLLCALLLVVVSIFTYKSSILVGVMLDVIAVVIGIVLAVLYPLTIAHCSRLNCLPEIAIEILNGHEICIYNEEKISVEAKDIVKVWGETDSYTNGIVRNISTKGTLYVKTNYKKYKVDGVSDVPHAIKMIKETIKANKR